MRISPAHSLPSLYGGQQLWRDVSRILRTPPECNLNLGTLDLVKAIRSNFQETVILTRLSSDYKNARCLYPSIKSIIFGSAVEQDSTSQTLKTCLLCILSKILRDE